MAEANVELAGRCFDAVNRRDLEGLLALMDEEVEVYSRIVAMEGGLRGHEGVRRWWQNWFDAFPDYAIEVVEVRDLGEVTLAELRAVGHGAGSEVPFRDEIWHAGRWRGGKCVWWRVFYSRQEAIEAIGPLD